jgi:hypothetical protein
MMRLRVHVQESLLLVLLASGSPALAAAQNASDIVGIVRDSAGAPISGADVGIIAQRKLTKTDESGRFVFRDVAIGAVSVTVRRLGYQPATATFTHGTKQDSLEVTLQPHVALLAGIEVRERDLRRLFWIEDFHRRRMRGIGTYIMREEIEARRASRTSDLFRTIPGIRFVNMQGRTGVRFVSAPTQRRDCIPMIWLDGQRAGEMEVDEIPVTDIEGMELYHGPSTTPLQFSQSHGTRTSCGTIVIWSRVPGM